LDTVKDKKRQAILLGRIRILLLGFTIGLLLSGLTAIPLRWELNHLAQFLGASPADTVDTTTGFLQWVVKVMDGLNAAYAVCPFVAYGTDWLAFGHIAIAIAFIGPLRDPIRNIWVIEFGMITCALVVPFALIFGPIRDIPFFHQLIDCSFGVVGIVPLWLARRYTLELAKL